MAGKHAGIGAAGYAPSTGTEPPVYPGSKLDRAYSEGRGDDPASNPHPAGTPENAAYAAGAAFRTQASEQVQTCWPAIEVPPDVDSPISPASDPQPDPEPE